MRADSGERRRAVARQIRRRRGVLSAMTRRTARVEGDVDHAVDVTQPVYDAEVVGADDGRVAGVAIGELRVWRRGRCAVTRRATKRLGRDPAR